MPEAAVAPAAPAAPPTVDIKASPFAALDSKVKTPPPPPKPPEPAKSDAPAKAPEAKIEAKVDAKAPEKPSASSKDDRTAKDPKWFREQHEKAQTEIKERDTKLKALEARLADAEARGKDTTSLAERIAALEKERDEAYANLRAVKQEVSPEFKAKWDKPFEQAADYAKTIVEKLNVGKMVMDEATGEAKWTPQGKADFDKDFARIYHLNKNDPAGAIEEAEKVFGRASQIVLNHVNELERLDRGRSLALEEEKNQWKERSAKDEAQRIQYDKSFRSMKDIAMQHLAEANEAFRDAPGDESKVDRELRQEGYAIFDAKPDTIQQAAIKAAEVRHRVAAHPVLLRKIDTLQSRLKEAEDTIAELNGSKPGKGRTTTSSAGGGEESWQEELRKEVPAGMP